MPRKQIQSIRSKGYIGIIAFLLLIVVDRLTKTWASSLKSSIDYGLFAFTYVQNTGAGFSILQNSNVMLAWIAVMAIGVLIYFYSSIPRSAFILMLAGIIGNLIDRLSYGYVVDFMNLKFWPIFNLADSMIFFGVIILAVHAFKHEKKTKKRTGRKAK